MSLEFHWGRVLTVDGTATGGDVATLFAAVMEGAPTASTPVELHLYGLDLDTGAAAVAWHQITRMLRDHFGMVTLVEAPQMLAHSLYKVGDLADGRIVLVSPRTDEGITAN